MNIFVVDQNPRVAAQSLPDALVRKMPVESCQMLAHWAHALYDKPVAKKDGTPYIITKSIMGHPCTKWVIMNSDHAYWLLLHGMNLCEEYQIRYHRPHATYNSLCEVCDIYNSNHSYPSIDDLLNLDFKPFVPDQYKNTDVVSAYRDYLMNEKGYAEWKYCRPPLWWDDKVHAPARQKYLIDKELKKLARRNRAMPT